MNALPGYGDAVTWPVGAIDRLELDLLCDEQASRQEIAECAASDFVGVVTASPMYQREEPGDRSILENRRVTLRQVVADLLCDSGVLDGVTDLLIAAARGQVVRNQALEVVNKLAKDFGRIQSEKDE